VQLRKTLRLKVDPQKPEIEKIRIAADFIRKGGLVAFPTETVYGLGADALNPKAVLALFKAKERPIDNPPIVHIGSLKQIYKLAKNVSSKAQKLMETFWPGPLTLIFKRSSIVPEVTVAGLDTIAIRMPKHNVALALLRESECPIAAPSANLAGKPSPTTAQHVLDDLKGRIDVVLDAGSTLIGVESTVLDLTVEPPQILRPGGTPYEELRKVLKNVELHPVTIAEKEVSIEKARSPGVMHRHYAPNAQLIVVEGEVQAIIDKIKELVKTYMKEGKKVGVLATDETLSYYEADVVKSLGSRKNISTIARNLFKLLREFDIEKVDLIIAEGVPLENLGLAVMNRLRKASGYNIIRT